MKKRWLIYIILILIITPTIIRYSTHREIDDINPLIPCKNEAKYIEKSEILWVIPKFKGIPISENKTWCKKILDLNKTLQLHGITHSYKEFELTNISQDQIDEAKKIFKDCFGYEPTMFKPPQMAINQENKQLIEKNFELRTEFDQTIHKVYHCNDSGITPNWIHDLF